MACGKEPIVLTRRGKGVAALISSDELELLLQIEDYIDSEDAKNPFRRPGTAVSFFRIPYNRLFVPCLAST
ncbi:MAG: type II toxin-antitoxin system Phd/YefM family antitoxin [Proteobacteria bacterium]|nr:type II toxin-antitoxin system Phd/YefM family antitoxin [Pseudomonadota bacterium]MBU4119548.1 type II toxin-antitoxin system Phd/YefM family antitoxin [Pseudomonadota bacterium]